uniref:hypothetical protein n=1 Tax=Amycolatopsis sp. CA-151526 TaxID=3239921 RepID=UPI003F493818
MTPDEPAEPVILTQHDAVNAFARWISDPTTPPEDVDAFIVARGRRRREARESG